MSDVAAPKLAPAGKSELRRADPCTFVIFGAGGDLTKRLLVPALYNLAAARLLPDAFAVIGVGRSDVSDDDFRAAMRAALNEFATLKVVPPTADRLLSHASYVCGDFNDPGVFQSLRRRLAAVERASGTQGNALFYLATPPEAFAIVARGLGEAGLAREERGWRRIIIEKPFGRDLSSACELNRKLLAVFAENQIYRIDHYLGKETVQNIMVLRFANGLFEPLWNRDHIDHVQITVAESLTVESRGKFYDRTGALRDMVPNHLFQLLALTAMEPPTCFESAAVRNEKLKPIEAIHPLSADSVAREVVRAQYTDGSIGGKRVAAYRRSSGVDPTSETETFVALRFSIDNWRWAGVPFYLRTGKALAARKTEVAIKFKSAPFALFRDTPVESLSQNMLVLRIQPDEGAALHFNAKIPGPRIRTGGVRMDFKYKDYFEAEPNTGYETLIYDCMIGDSTLFQRARDIEAGWRVVQPILDAWQDRGHGDLRWYAAGSNGPREAGSLLVRGDHAWRDIA